MHSLPLLSQGCIALECMCFQVMCFARCFCFVLARGQIPRVLAPQHEIAEQTQVYHTSEYGRGSCVRLFWASSAASYIVVYG